jgi:hypothetical protein
VSGAGTSDGRGDAEGVGEGVADGATDGDADAGADGGGEGVAGTDAGGAVAVDIEGLALAGGEPLGGGGVADGPGALDGVTGGAEVGVDPDAATNAAVAAGEPGSGGWSSTAAPTPNAASAPIATAIGNAREREAIAEA